MGKGHNLDAAKFHAYQSRCLACLRVAGITSEFTLVPTLVCDVRYQLPNHIQVSRNDGRGHYPKRRLDHHLALAATLSNQHDGLQSLAWLQVLCRRRYFRRKFYVILLIPNANISAEGFLLLYFPCCTFVVDRCTLIPCGLMLWLFNLLTQQSTGSTFCCSWLNAE